MTLLFALTAAVVVLAAFKLMPRMLPNTHAFTSDAAYAQCLQNTAEIGRSGCVNFGFPSGSTRPFGLPVALGAKVLFGGDGSISLRELRFVYAAILLAAFALACVFFRRIAGSWRLGIVGAALYLLSPVVQQQSGYASLQLGFALIPGYVVIDSLLLHSIRGGKAHAVLASILTVLLSRTFALYTDGYSFIFSSMLTCIYFFAASTPRKEWRSGAYALSCYIAITAVAAFAYKQYIADTALSAMPLSFFRGAGVDVANLIAPVATDWPYKLLGIGLNINSDMIYAVGADVSTLMGTFIGYSYLLAAAILVWLLARHKLEWNNALSSAVVAAGLLALVLSLGPSLKFFDFREPGNAIPMGSFERYLMAPEEASFALPTAWVYEHVPGIKNIRALARWLVLARIAWITALLVVVAWLFRSRYRKSAIALVAVAMLETCPNLPDMYQEGRQATAYAVKLYGEYGQQFSEGVKPGERTLLIQLHDDADPNEYASDIFCARAKALCYNAGGDKTAILVQPHWPREIQEANWGHHLADNLRDAFDKKYVDVVVVPNFDLRWVMLSERRGRVATDIVRQRASALAAAVGADIAYSGRFSFLRRPKAPTLIAGVPASCGIDCWRSWPIASDKQQIAWGPNEAVAGKPFNAQVNGTSAIWVGLSDPDQRYVLAFDDRLIPTNSTDAMLVGFVSAEVSASLLSKSQYPVYLVDRKERKLYKLGVIRAL